MLKEYLKEKKELVEKTIDSYLGEFDYPYAIAEGMKYAVLNGGKRIRPVLILMTLNLLGKDEKLGLPSGAALEMIHSYSLVHDDLPALDNDDYRRGKLTTHKKFGEAEGILIGDFETNLENRDEIIGKLESGELSLENSIKEYEKAMKLIKSSSEILDRAEGKIIKVSENDGEITFEEGDV